jgi:TolB protein
MKSLAVSLLPLLLLACADRGRHITDPRETFLENARQLTFGGQNAEAYFSFDGSQLVFQASGEYPCDQIFTMAIDGSGKRLVSTGKGRTTCAYFLPGDERIVFASTHLGGDECPPEPDRSEGYVWPIYPSYDLFTVAADGSDLQRLTATPGYDAEATVSPDGRRMVFTSMRDGDLELYAMDLDGGNLLRLTNEKGYDGGAFFSPDSKLICYRASHPKDEESLTRYERLLEKGLVEPRALDLYVMNVDGTNRRQVTNNGKANFCPFFTPDGKHLIFASNMGDPRGREFDLYLVSIDGGDPIRVTYSADFDGFPMFSPDGKKLVFASNRNGSEPHETNVFIADWMGPR